MNTKYWIKIALGSLVIFGVGLGLMAGLRRGKESIRSITLLSDSIQHGSGPVALRVPFLPVYVAGDKIGKLDTVVLKRHQVGQVDGVRIVVKPTHRGIIRDYADCQFRLRDLNHIELKDALTCARNTEGLVPFGEVVFLGSPVESPLLISASELENAPWPTAHHDSQANLQVDLGPEFERQLEQGLEKMEEGLERMAEEIERAVERAEEARRHR